MNSAELHRADRIAKLALQAAQAKLLAQMVPSERLRAAALEEELNELMAEPPAPAPTPEPVTAPATIWSHGSRTYSIDGTSPILVSEEEDSILTAFLEKGTAMDERELQEKSGATNVPRVIATLVKRYGAQLAPAIRTPEGKKCNGGYYIRVFHVKK